ncbi:MAG: tRNA (guanosine(37)-N1)-methyltransferase TrmD [Lachnospiraceae bacterium]|nr:tRNA (guanosine(37)-N1)-methyltransferase TrmD [Lachnospiraceae bacterium]
MKFHILTLFPDMIMQGLGTSIIGRAVEKQVIAINAVNIREYTKDKHGKVDDYTYGGGAGMLMQAQPVYDAWQTVAGGKRPRTIYVTPQGVPFTQKLAMELSKEEELIFLCGHYEGIDERVLEETVTDYVSIGDYVLTGGELPAMVMIDAISRLVPGVLNNEVSAQTESFHNDLLEYPQYSRPECWHEKKVPEVLLSGNGRKIAEWRLAQSIERTRKRRPDLYLKYVKKQEIVKALSRNKRRNIPLMEALNRGQGEVLYAKGNDVLLLVAAHYILISAQSSTSARELIKKIPQKGIQYVLVLQDFVVRELQEEIGYRSCQECYQVCYTQREALYCKHKDIRLLSEADAPFVIQNSKQTSTQYIMDRIQAKALYGAYVEERLIGFAGFHESGGIGMLFVEEDYRKQRIGSSLEAYVINRQREWDYTPYAHIPVENETARSIQERLGLYQAKETVWWIML